MSSTVVVEAAIQRPASVTFRKGSALDAVVGTIQWDLSTKEFLVVRVPNGDGAADLWIARRFVLLVKFIGTGADAHRLEART